MGTARILVIDDDPVNRTLIKAMLDARGYETLLAANGDDGITMAREERPDLIICDLVMPGIDGFEVAQRLRSSRTLRQIPLVALSASEWPEGDVRTAGFDDHVFKPVEDLVVFLRRLDDMLVRRVRRSSA